MTVSYQYEVASSTSGGFTRLLFMWRGSLYKLIYRELLMFLAFFGTISALYRHVLTVDQKRAFEQIVVYCDTFINLIPLSFVLGFYVAYVANRWWQQYTAIPWPDKVMHSVALYVIGNDEYGRMVRRALMRYLNLSLILVLRSISSAVKRRFPTLDHVVDSGFMTSLELELFISVPSLEFNTYWIPCTWFINLLKEARTNHRLTDAQGLKIIMEEFNDFRSKCGMLWSYDWVSIPLVYTQVVTLATYSFFAVALVGRQYIEGAIKPFQMKADIYFPVFTVLQFFFFMGLLKVAEQLINPFGDDDEDFELNWLIDRHTKVSYLGVDTLMNRCPPLVKDIYYDSENIILPYTEAAAAYKRKTYRGSVANMTVPEAKQTMFLPNIIEEEETATANATPRTSSASLAVHNDSPPVSNRRQGGSSPQPSRQVSRQVSRGPGETIVTLDLGAAEDFDHQQQQQQQQQHQAQTADLQPGKTNGRPASALAEAVKIFSSKSKLTDHLQSRKPFFALAKTSKVSIQPWPSATNLKSEPVVGSDWNDQTRSFNIPSIDVRQSSLDDELDGDDVDDDDDDDDDDDEEEEVLPESGNVETAARKRSQAIFDARSGMVNRGFLCREASIEETQEPPEPGCPRCGDHTSSSSGGFCSTGFCPARQSQLQQARASTRAKKRTRSRTAARFHSFPKFLAKRQRAAAQRAGTPSSVASARISRSESMEESLAVSKSSPELTLAVEFGASASGSCERVRATFFTGDDEDEDEEHELKNITVKRS